MGPSQLTTSIKTRKEGRKGNVFDASLFIRIPRQKGEEAQRQ